MRMHNLFVPYIEVDIISSVQFGERVFYQILDVPYRLWPILVVHVSEYRMYTTAYIYRTRWKFKSML